MDFSEFEIEGWMELRKFISVLSFSEMTWNIRQISHEALFDMKSNKSIVIAKNIKIQELEKVVSQDNLFWKNYTKKENIYIYPNPDNPFFDFVFIDDIMEKSDIYRPFLSLLRS